MVPTAKAIIGVPKNLLISAHIPTIFAIETMEDQAINKIGTIIGAREINPFGSFPYSATSSS